MQQESYIPGNFLLTTVSGTFLSSSLLAASALGAPQRYCQSTDHKRTNTESNTRDFLPLISVYAYHSCPTLLCFLSSKVSANPFQYCTKPVTAGTCATTLSRCGNANCAMRATQGDVPDCAAFRNTFIQKKFASCRAAPRVQYSSFALTEREGRRKARFTA